MDPAALFDLSSSEPSVPGFFAAEFNGVDQYLRAPDAPELRGGDVDFAVTVRFMLLSLPEFNTEYILIGKDSDALDSRDYTVDVASGEDGSGNPVTIVRFYINGGGPGGAIVAASKRPVAGSWYRATAFHDAANDLIGFILDDDDPDTAPTGGSAPHTSAAEFRVGSRQYAGFEGHAHARIASVAIWKPAGGIPGTIAGIHGNGTGGASYGDLSPSVKSELGLAAWWDLDEASGDRVDAHGSNDLAPVNGPTRYESPALRSWHRDQASIVGDWSLPPGTPAATYGHFGAYLGHAPGRAGFRRGGISWFPGTSWEVGVRASVAIRPGMDPVELCRSVGPDGTIARLVIDDQGRPSFRNSGPGGSGEVAATCPVPLYGRLAVTGGAVTDIGVRLLPGDTPHGPERSLCRLDVEDLGNLGVGDVVTVEGCGVPFDGEHTVQSVLDGATPHLYFPVAGNDHLAATPTAGEVIPTGEYDLATLYESTPWDELPTRQRWSAPLRVRRDGGLVRFFVAGFELGSASPGGLPAGPAASGSTSWVGSGDPSATGGPDSLPSRVEGFVGTLPEVSAAALDLRLDARVSGAIDYAGMACHVEYEAPPGVPRRLAHLCDPITVFVDKATGGIVSGPSDAHTGDAHGIGKGQYTACPLGNHGQAEESGYEAWGAIFAPRWDLDGTPRPPALVAMTKVADVRRLPWDDRLHVDHDAAGGGDGTEGSPWNHLENARPHFRPGVLVRVRGGFEDGISLFGARGPLGVVRWGETVPEIGNGVGTGFAGCFLVSSSTHVLVDGFTARLTSGDGQVWHAGRVLGLTARNVDGVKASGGGSVTLMSAHELAYVSISDCVLDGDTAFQRYLIYLQAVARRVSLRRIRSLHGNGDEAHAFRSQTSEAVELSGYRLPPEMTGSWGVGVTSRFGPRKIGVYHCDLGNRPLYFSTSNDAPYQSNVADPPASRCVAEQVYCRSVIHEGVHGGRTTACYGEMEPHRFVLSLDPADHHPGPAVADGNHAVSGSDPTVQVAAGYSAAIAPTTGPRRNAPGGGTWPDDLPRATGSSLSAPAAVALEGAPGWAVAVADGTAQGGAGLRRLVGMIDGSPSGQYGGLIVLPLPDGSYGASFGASDSASASAAGASVQVVVTSEAPQESVTTYSTSGPATVRSGKRSGPFSVELGPGTLDGQVVVAPSDGGAGGAFAPASVTLSDSVRLATFRYTASTDGGVSISTTNDRGLADPDPIEVDVLEAIVFGPSAATITLDAPAPSGGEGSLSLQWEWDDGGGWMEINGETSASVSVDVPESGPPIRIRLRADDGSGVPEYSPEFIVQPRPFRVASFQRFPM